MTKILWVLAYIVAPLFIAVAAFSSGLAFASGRTFLGWYDLFLAMLWIGLRFWYRNAYRRRKSLEDNHKEHKE